MSTLDALDQSLLGPSFDVNSEEKVVVKAEDLAQEGSSFDFTKHFFEPQPGNTYLIKFLPNPRDAKGLISHRSLYRSLPDPDRRGKTFHYISSGNSKTCPVLQLFFDLNEAKKNGDAIAGAKIEKYLNRSQQGCALIQILSSPIKEEIGQIRLFIYSTFGANATIANLINQKINPTKEQINAGFEREDIFNIFGSSVLSLTCKESVYGDKKGRDYSSSSWAPKMRGAIAYLEDGTTHEFNKNTDIVNGALTDAVKPYFEAFKKTILNPDYDVFIHFCWKRPEEIVDNEETKTYLESVNDKVERIVKIIREKSLAEIATVGSVESTSDSNQPSNILESSVPEELKDMVSGDSTASTKQADSKDDILNDILN